jgi:hypothetical protein
MTKPHGLWEPVRAILRWDWNPIGLDDLPEDEYDAYVWPIISMIEGGASLESVADYLDWASSENMCCPVPREINLQFAVRLSDLKTDQPNDQ